MIKIATWEHEQFKQSMRDRVDDFQPMLMKVMMTTVNTSDMATVETIIDEHVVRELIPKLKTAGAEGIIEYPLNKVVY